MTTRYVSSQTTHAFHALFTLTKTPRSYAVNWTPYRPAAFTMTAPQLATAASRQQPPWEAPPNPPPDCDLPPLTVWNSLTRSKTPFVPIDWKNKSVSIYACGVTPYDDAHLGHIRNYTTLDIVVRILRDFFKFKVRLVMNVTDVDDKIILRARQRHLLDNFLGDQLEIDGFKSENGLVEVGLSALRQYIKGNLKIDLDNESLRKICDEISKLSGARASSEDVGEGVEQIAKKRMHARTALNASRELLRISKDGGIHSHDLDDVLMPYLDSKASIDANDHSIFSKVSRKFEERFWEDLASVNCLPVEEITRVTEYVPQIIDFTKRIEENGFAYKTSDGSVYFDIEAFEKGGNKYPRLEPWSRNDAGLQADGEGALTRKNSEKRGNSDFALWKSSKAGEPSWDSPWGKGRPGWHIECSAMASDKLGSQFDIHSGGIDLAFPHHDNELAQSEAYWHEPGHSHQHQWVNYFLHMGHLSIAGAKMSKSLKNFTTIREALARGDWTPRGLRIIFLLGGWRDGIEIKEGLIKEGSVWEDKLNNFFLKAKDVAQSFGNIDTTSNGVTNGMESTKNGGVLGEKLEKSKSETFAALCDSFNTAKVMEIISDLISFVNISESPNPAPVLRVASWITSMVNIFGLNGTASADDSEIGWSGLDIPSASKGLLSALSQMRDSIRTLALSPDPIQRKTLDPILQDPKYDPEANPEAPNDVKLIMLNFRKDVASLDGEDTSKDILQLCDRLRDVDLWDRGIYLEDREGEQPALLRVVTRELRTARQEKEDRERQKQQAKQAREQEAATKAEKGRLSHQEMFKTKGFSAWDSDGIPTKDEHGEEINKSKSKKLKKDWERQKKLHEAWLKTQ